MTASRTTLRLITLLFLLAGILLLRKPVLGQAPAGQLIESRQPPAHRIIIAKTKNRAVCVESLPPQSR
jgi:hypothetical protein